MQNGAVAEKRRAAAVSARLVGITGAYDATASTARFSNAPSAAWWFLAMIESTFPM